VKKYTTIELVLKIKQLLPPQCQDENVDVVNNFVATLDCRARLGSVATNLPAFASKIGVADQEVSSCVPRQLSLPDCSVSELLPLP
jgi:hypothetical protein